MPFLGGEEDSAFVAKMKVAQRLTAVRMSQLSGSGDKVRICTPKPLPRIMPSKTKSLVPFLGGEKESAFVAYMKVGRRRAAVQMSQLSWLGEQVREFPLGMS